MIIRSLWRGPLLSGIFVGFWCKGLSVAEAAARLRADPASATECGWTEIGDGLDDLNPDDGVVWIGEQVPGWTQVILYQDLHAGLNEPLTALSQGGELLYLGWPLLELEGAEDLEYMVDGRYVMSMSPADPAERDGPEPGALDRYMVGLPLNRETPVDERLDAVFRLVGRVTGRELDADWLRGRHTRYIVPANAWERQRIW
jgi:hypothetical protein